MTLPSGNPQALRPGESPNANRDFTDTPPSPEEINAMHRYDDSDTSPESHHHTLGIDNTQASPGDHLHDGKTGKILSDYLPTTGVRPTVSESRGGNAALADLLSVLHNLGIINNQTSI